jgi:hypothetical protein
MGFFYYVGAALESVLSVFGVRATYEQPKYHVVGRIGDQVEVRQYGALRAAETPIDMGNDGAAFGRLFRYIAGANQDTSKIAMTVPVEMAPPPAAAPVAPEQATPAVMRLFLPRHLAQDAPAPTDPKVHLVTLPQQTLAVLHFSGELTPDSRRAHQAELLADVAAGGWVVAGAPLVLSYDPPFALPFVRHNEVAVQVQDKN